MAWAMRPSTPLSLVFALLLGLLGAPVAKAQRAFNDSLDQLADRVAKRLVLAERPRVAVAELTDPSRSMEPALLTYVEELLISRLVQAPGITVLERRGLDKVMEEQRRTATGSFDERSAIELGRLLAADAIITGSVFRVDKRMHLIVRMLDTGTGILIGSTETFTDFPKGKEPGKPAEPTRQRAQEPTPVEAGHLELRAALLGYSFYERNVPGGMLEASFRTLGEDGRKRGNVSIGFQLAYWHNVGSWSTLPFDFGHLRQLEVRGSDFLSPTIRLGNVDVSQGQVFLMSRAGVPISFQPMSNNGFQGTEVLELDVYTMTNMRMSMGGFNIPLRWYLGNGRFGLPRLYMEVGMGLDLLTTKADYEGRSVLMVYDQIEQEYVTSAGYYGGHKPLSGDVPQNLLLTHASFGGGVEMGRFNLFLQGKYLLSTTFTDMGRSYDRVRGNILALPLLAGADRDTRTLSDLQRDGIVRFGALDLERERAVEEGGAGTTIRGNGVSRFLETSHLMMGFAFRFR